MGQATVESISKSLPGDSAYVDFARIKPYDFKKNKYSEPRYFAFVLLPGDTLDVNLLDLGEAEKIDKQAVPSPKEEPTAED